MIDNQNSTNTFSEKDLSLQQKLESLPNKSGVYQFFDKDKNLLYVGKAANLRNRVRQYFQNSRNVSPRIAAMIAKIYDLELIVTDTEVEALILESNLIKKLHPRYNIIFKDDKSYPYIAVTKEEFPRIMVSRRKIPNATYFGPYTDVRAMRSALKIVRDIFFIRSCNLDLSFKSIRQKKFKVCLDYHINKCEGPCEAFVSAEHYQANIEKAKKILQGKIKDVVALMQKEMDTLSALTKYEEAAKIRDRILALNVYLQKQKIVDSRNIDRDVISIALKDAIACAVIFKIREGRVIGSRHFYITNILEKKSSELLESVLENYYSEQDDIPENILIDEEIENHDIIAEWFKLKRNANVCLEHAKIKDDVKLIGLTHANAQFWLDEYLLTKITRDDFIPKSIKALQRDLRLANPPRRIECFDISNTQGSNSVASLVVFLDGKPKKSEYRKFQIKTVIGPNDFESMQEVIQRRYSKLIEEKAALPNLIIVDGGKGQLSAALKILNKISLKNMPIIGLAKRLEEVFLPDNNQPLILDKTSSSLRLLKQIRDEAHRFAINYHRALRAKNSIKSELDDIKGVGEKRKQMLLQTFGSVNKIKNASIEDVAKVVGGVIAKKIKSHFVNIQN